MAARRPLVLVTGTPNTIRRLINGDSSLVESLADRNGKVWLDTVELGTAANNVRIKHNSASLAPEICVVGSDTNIDLRLNAKGSGRVMVGFDRVVTELTTQTLQGKDLQHPENTLPFNAGRGSVRQLVKNGGASSFVQVGFTAAPTTDGTVSSADSADRPLLAFTTGATAGDKAGFVTPAETCRPVYLPEIVFPIRWGPDVDNMRFWAGFSSADLATVDTPTSQRVAAFRWSDNVDSEVQMVCCDGTTAEEVATGYTPTTDDHKVLRIRLTGTSAKFFIDTNEVGELSNNPPTSVLPLFVWFRVETTSNDSRVVRCGSVALSML